MQRMTMMRQVWRNCVFCIEGFREPGIAEELQLRYFI